MSDEKLLELLYYIGFKHMEECDIVFRNWEHKKDWKFSKILHLIIPNYEIEIDNTFISLRVEKSKNNNRTYTAYSILKTDKKSILETLSIEFLDKIRKYKIEQIEKILDKEI